MPIYSALFHNQVPLWVLCRCTSCTEICAGFKFPFPVYPKTFWGRFSSSAVLRYIHDFCAEHEPIEDSFLGSFAVVASYS